jgi:putative DNA primase/helicase
MFDGGGANGKSTLVNMLTTYIGEDNTSNIALQDLIHKRFARGQLYNKHLNIYSDLSSQAVEDTGIFKMITGSDMIYADRKFKDGFNFRSFAKQVYSCNKIPISRDDTDAYFRRWILLSFPNRFEGKDANPNILEELTTDQEISGLFNWALIGLERLRENRSFSYNKSTEVIRNEYERKSNPVVAFIKDCLEENFQSVETKEDIYNRYKEYCEKEHLPVKANNAFARELKQNISYLDEQQFGDGRQKKRAWIGVRIK